MSLKPLFCSWCGKSNREVTTLVAGDGVFICDGCVEFCAAVIRAKAKGDAPRVVEPEGANDILIRFNPPGGGTEITLFGERWVKADG